MNNKALTLSLVMAVMAVFFVQSYVTSIEDEAKKKFGTEVLVVSAKADVAEMETIDETMLELKPIPQRFLEPGAVAYSPRQDQNVVISEMKELAGSVAVVPIRKGEQITLNKITEPSLRTGLSPQVTPGRRAMAIPIDESSGVSKLIKPGDRVDVVAIFTSQTKQRTDPLGAVLSKTILQDVGVLSVGKNVTNNIARTLEQDGVHRADHLGQRLDVVQQRDHRLLERHGQAQPDPRLVQPGDERRQLFLGHVDRVVLPVRQAQRRVGGPVQGRRQRVRDRMAQYRRPVRRPARRH